MSFFSRLGKSYQYCSYFVPVFSESCNHVIVRKREKERKEERVEHVPRGTEFRERLVDASMAIFQGIKKREV